MNVPSASQSIALAALLILAAALGCSRIPSTPEPKLGSRTLTVCELFKDLGEYSGKTLTVRGIYYFGLRQPNCGWSLVAGGRIWPMALDLVGIDEIEPGSDSRTSVPASWQWLQTLVIQQGRTGQQAEIWLTVTGQLRGPRRESVPNGGVTAGYGHLAAFPAQLIVERIRNIEVKPIPTFDYSRMLPPNLKPKPAPAGK